MLKKKRSNCSYYFDFKDCYVSVFCDFITNAHEEGEDSVGGSDPAVVAGGKVAEEGTAGTLEHVVSNIQDPEANDKKCHSTGAGFLWEVVAHGVPNVCGEADEEDSNSDGDRASKDKGAATAKAGGAAITGIAHNGLDNQPRNGPTEPDKGGPLVRDTK